MTMRAKLFDVKKTAAGIIAMTVLLIVLLSAFCLGLEAGHDCCGEDCQDALCINRVRAWHSIHFVVFWAVFGRLALCSAIRHHRKLRAVDDRHTDPKNRPKTRQGRRAVSGAVLRCGDYLRA